MQTSVTLLLVLLALLACGQLLSRRTGIPAPVLLAIGGAGLSFLPWLPREPLDPDLILFLFLPPLLYSDAFDTSWTDFRRWWRPILMLAVGLVAFTIIAVGFVAHACLPKLPWAVCFTLGAIVSPTDTVAVQSILDRLRLPRRATAIIGGESLTNDATGLLGVQIGVAVVASGAVAAKTIAIDFAWIAGGGAAIGIVAGILFALINRYVRDTGVLFVASLIAPFAAFLAAHHWGTSGVLAVVVAGFIVSWRIQDVPSAARVEMYATWSMMTLVLNGLCFALIGLEAPRLLMASKIADNSELLVAGLMVSAAVILARVAWVLPMAYAPIVLPKRVRDAEGGYPSFRSVVLASWCGMRGVISLAAALSIPTLLEDGTPFPGRSAVLACTVVVILVTLVVQGLTLEPLVRLLKIPHDADSEVEVLKARETLLAAGIDRLDAYCSEASCPISVHRFRAAMADELVTLREESQEERDLALARIAVSEAVQREVVQAQQAALLELRNRGAINDKTYLDLQLDLDRTHFRPET